MKKCIYILSILSIGLLSSCNDDIPIDEIKQSFEVTFQLNPETVIESFYNTRSDIERLNSNQKLRLRLLIYNDEGVLVSSTDGIQKTSYLEKENVTIKLNEGHYLAIAISDIINPNNTSAPENWKLSGEQKISTLTISDAGYLGGQSKIVGIASTQFVADKNGVVHSLALKPIGAIIYIYYANIHYFNNVEAYSYSCDKIANYIVFDDKGNFTPSFAATGIIDLSRFDPNDTYFDDVNNVYDYAFVLPMQEFPTAFFAAVDGEWYYMSDAMTLTDVAEGKEYFAYIDMAASADDNYNAQCKRWGKGEKGPWVQNSKSPIIKSPHMEKQFTRTNHNFIQPQRPSIKIMDLIQ